MKIFQRWLMEKLNTVPNKAFFWKLLLAARIAKAIDVVHNGHDCIINQINSTIHQNHSHQFL